MPQENEKPYIIEYWCDSGANCESCYRDEISIEEMGINNLEWDELTDEEKDKLMRGIALERLDWGYRIKE